MELVEGVLFNLHLHRKPAQPAVSQSELRKGQLGMAVDGEFAGHLVLAWPEALLDVISQKYKSNGLGSQVKVQPFTTSDAVTLIFK